MLRQRGYSNLNLPIGAGGLAGKFVQIIGTKNIIRKYFELVSLFGTRMGSSDSFQRRIKYLLTLKW